MKLLIVTQKVDINDDVLGFFHDWIKEFAENCEKVTVICLEKGEHDLSDNVRIESLGKEENNFQFSIFNFQTIFNFKIFQKIKYLFRFYSLVWKYKKDYDRVFVHMIPMYASIGAPLWKVLGKRTGLWYAHGSVSFSLKLAEKLVDTIFTSTKEGCRINSKKIHIVGQGIDLNKFESHPPQADQQSWKVESDMLNIITIGRIAPVKDYRTLIRAVDILVNEKGLKNIRVKIIGGTLLAEHKSYSANLKEMVSKKKLENYIEFIGSVPYRNIFKYIREADLMASTSRTGSLDKVMLETMSFGVGVVTCNEAVRYMFGDYKGKLTYKESDHNELAERINWFIHLSGEERRKIGKDLREVVVKEHNLKGLIKKILKY